MKQVPKNDLTDCSQVQVFYILFVKHLLPPSLSLSLSSSPFLFPILFILFFVALLSFSAPRIIEARFVFMEIIAVEVEVIFFLPIFSSE